MALSRTLGVLMAGGFVGVCGADTTIEAPPNSSAEVEVTVEISTALGSDSDTQSSGVNISASSMVVDPSPDTEPFTDLEIHSHDILVTGASMTFEFYCVFGACLEELDVEVQTLDIMLSNDLFVPVSGKGHWVASSADFHVDLALTYSGSLIGEGETIAAADASAQVEGDIYIEDGLLIVDGLELDTIVVDIPDEDLPDGLGNLVISVETDFAGLVYSGFYNTCDLDGDGVIGGSDLTILLGQWGTCCVADLDGSGNVDGADLTILLACWTP